MIRQMREHCVAIGNCVSWQYGLRNRATRRVTHSELQWNVENSGAYFKYSRHSSVIGYEEPRAVHASVSVTYLPSYSLPKITLRIITLQLTC
jgi:hypothetical protein